MVSKLVVHVPHASTFIPEDAWTEFLVSRQEVEAEALASADLYTDEMARQAWPHARIVEAEVSRIVVDVERYDDDSREEMSEAGRGVMYTCDHLMRPIRRPMIGSRREELLERYYRQHWNRLRLEAADSVLVDLHTYPASPWPIERHAGGARPEIDIGFTEGLTPPLWGDALTQHFRESGYEVGHNTPYVGVVDAGASAAVMIEIRRDIVGQPNGTDPKWKRLIDALRSMPVGL
jgi:N-formylglutamate deformylase